jgi:hypothetical protein
VRQRDLARLQAGLVGDVALGRERQPDCLFRVAVVVFEKVALGRGLGLFLGGLFDVCEEGFGGFESLFWGGSESG